LGSMVVAEAAVFADASWEGDERVAAFMVATQFGNQSEYDRIVTAVQTVLAGGADDAEKILRIRMKLGELPVNLQSSMTSAFQLWFPGLPDCNQRYARAM
jgi:hypothetical protein